MLEIELDGKKVSVAEGSMVMHAADAVGTYIPHFCYHKKLSIAANCRMCLVDIEKMPKPMPACATPVTAGMIVRTRSPKALAAQQGVMEFLLINHPLDCPICDQGGECQLQDLAVGYGKSSSRFTEEKRVVFPKDVGPLLSMAEMTRCIHCTRCVRFGQEVGGVMELGMIHRGEHSEITTVRGDTVDSELSGNMIDVCPVGAITSKPFRYSARTWELSRRKSVSPHDSTGANLIVQVKGAQVMRVLPFENEAVNECWLADRDRFSYEALNTTERLAAPMVRDAREGAWKPIDWAGALELLAAKLKGAPAGRVGAVAAPTATVEELHLLQKLVRGLGSENVDARPRAAVSPRRGAPVRTLGRSVASLSTLSRALVVGSFLRKDHPLFAQRLRQAAKQGCKVMSVHALRDDWLLPVGPSVVAPPSRWAEALGSMLGESPAAGDDARAIASMLRQGAGDGEGAILLGNAVATHPDAPAIERAARALGAATGMTVGWLGEGGNAVGADLVEARPGEGGRDAHAMLSGDDPLHVLIALHAEPLLDAHDGAAAARALAGTGFVARLTPFRPTDGDDGADLLLPVAPFTETSGTFVNAEGRVQPFHGVVKPLGETRPGWKVLRVLGNLLGLPGFDFETSDGVRAEAIGDAAGVASRLATPASVAGAEVDAGPPVAAGDASGALERIADVPIYAVDAIVRRSPPLQATADARRAPIVGVPSEWAAEHGLVGGGPVRVSMRGGDGKGVVLPAVVDATLAAGVVRVPAGLPATAALGPMHGAVTLETVAAAAPVVA